MIRGNAATHLVSAEGLLNKVTDGLGLDDFGDERFVDDYTRALTAINEEVALSSTGVAILEEMVSRMLTNRLRMQRDLKAHPEIRDEVLAPPIVITGFARSGTTKLQRMISVSPRVQSLALWRLLNPAPFPGAATHDADPRIAWTQEVARMTQQMFPHIWAAHPTPALDAEEDFLLQDMTFIAPTVPMRVGARRYLEALTPIDDRVYAFLRTVLQYLQWQDGSPDRASRPWILKSPIHIGNLLALQRIFPGAKIVHSHRDVDVAMASLSSLDRISRCMFADTLDLKSIGSGTLAYWGREWARNLEQRAHLVPKSYCDVSFADINRNAMAVIERVHAFAGLELDSRARAAMLQWEANNPRHQGGRHVYSAADYGLTSSRVRDAFAAYFAYFADKEIIGARV